MKIFMIKSLLICFSIIVLPQQADSLIQIYPGIGDTLTNFDRTYIGLFPEVKDFEYAVFYIRNNEKFVAKIYSSTNDTTNETIRIQNISSFDSIYSIIRQVDFINSELRTSTNDVYFETIEGNWIEGQLEMFDSKYIYVLSDNVTSDHFGYMRYRIPVSSINGLTIEGSSNTLMGMCIGGGIGGVVGAIVYSAIRKEDKSDSFKNCSQNITNSLNAAAAFAAITLGGFLIGTLVGASTSTDDNDIYFDTEMDVLKLSGHCAYVLDKEMLNEEKYYDIY